jgi:hypothetical protein
MRLSDIVMAKPVHAYATMRQPIRATEAYISLQYSQKLQKTSVCMLNTYNHVAKFNLKQYNFNFHELVIYETRRKREKAKNDSQTRTDQSESQNELRLKLPPPEMKP